jgi:hypothetical protein
MLAASRFKSRGLRVRLATPLIVAPSPATPKLTHYPVWKCLQSG